MTITSQKTDAISVRRARFDPRERSITRAQPLGRTQTMLASSSSMPLTNDQGIGGMPVAHGPVRDRLDEGEDDPLVEIGSGRARLCLCFAAGASKTLAASYVVQALYPTPGTGFTYPSGLAPNDTVLALGYSTPGDNGGGYFQPELDGMGVLRDCNQATLVLTPPAGSTSTLTAGVAVADYASVQQGAIAAGMTVTGGSGSGFPILKFDPIMSTFSGSAITLYVPPTGTTQTAKLYLSEENGGSRVRASNAAQTSFVCFARVSSTYNQVEWGVGSQKGNDDTAALQNWLESSQPHIAVNGTATITAPLFCDTANGIIQGPPTQAVAEDSSIQPTFTINGNNGKPSDLYHGLSNSTGPGAMLLMTTMQTANPLLYAQCGLLGVGMVADNQNNGYYDVLHAYGKSNLVDGHSYLANGFHNVVAAMGGANLELYDSSFDNSFDDNVTVATPNAKIVRNSFAGAGAGYSGVAGQSGTNLKFGGTDALITENIIQQAAGWGLNLYQARSVRLLGNFFDNNGRQIGSATVNPTYGLSINNSAHVTVCDNTFSDSGAAALIAGLVSAHVQFAGSSDSISLCGNVYLPLVTSSSNSAGGSTPNSSLSSVLVHPDYAIDAAMNATVTNLTIADNPAPQNIAFLSSNAVNVVSGALANQPVPNYSAGLKVATTAGATALSVATGSAADSTNTRLMTLLAACPLDLGTVGLRGRDAGTRVAGNATYNVFIVAPPGLSTATCIASTGSQPSFYAADKFYQIKTFGMTVNGSTVVFNVGQQLNGTSYQGANNLTGNPLAGMASGDVVTGTGIPAATTITSLQPLNATFPGVSISSSGVTSCIIFPSPPLSNNPAYAVGFNVAGMNVQPNSFFSSVTASACGGGSNYAHFTISPPPAATTGTNTVTLAAGSDFAMTLSNNATATTPIAPFTPSALTIYAGTYRQLCTVTTDGNGNIKAGGSC